MLVLLFIMFAQQHYTDTRCVTSLRSFLIGFKHYVMTSVIYNNFNMYIIEIMYQFYAF